MRTPSLQKAFRNGFTLIELIIVVIVLAILLGLAIPSFLGAQDGASEVAAKGNLSTGYKAAKLGAAANGNRFDTGAALVTAIDRAEPELKVSSGTAPDACNLAPNAVMVGSDSTATDITMYARVGPGKTLRLTASATTSPQFSESPCGTTPSVVGSPPRQVSFPVVIITGGTGSAVCCGGAFVLHGVRVGDTLTCGPGAGLDLGSPIATIGAYTWRLIDGMDNSSLGDVGTGSTYTVQASDSRRTTTPYDLLVCGFTATNTAGSFVAVPGNFGGGNYVMP